MDERERDFICFMTSRKIQSGINSCFSIILVRSLPRRVHGETRFEPLQSK